MNPTCVRHGDVAVITLDNPPVNGMGHALRSAVADALRSGAADAGVRAMVITGAGNAFSGGADIREFNTPRALAEPTLRTLIDTVESGTKPVVAAINGTCFGGGLELSLACHYRVAKADAQLALPEVKLGLIPGAGGTQRLPRAVGIERAVEMITSGNPVKAAQLEATELIDAILEGDFVASAVAFAREAAAAPLRRLRDMPVEPAPAGFFDNARKAVAAASRGLTAPLACVDAIEAAATLPFDQGIRREREIFMRLIESNESKALRHAFFAERAAAKIPDVPADTPVRGIGKVAVVGAGTMGGGITMNFLSAGIPVTLLEVKPDALDRGVATIRRNYEASMKRGKLTAEKLDRAMALLEPTLTYDDLRDADLVIEAVFEEMGVKEGVFRKLDEVAKPGAILATNTSTLDVDRIASFTRRPDSVVGLHFFSPANVMKLLEVVRGNATAKDVMATVMQLARRIGKTAVVSGVCDGFIGNRMLERYQRQCFYLLEEGASPQQVDRALEKFGLAMGLFRVGDLAGNDIGWAVRKRRYAENPGVPYSKIADRLCELGRFGQKTGAGWYRYEPGKRDPIPDPEVEKIIADYRNEKGLAARAIPDAEIVDRCVFALANEGARILQEGIAQRASDIDVVYLTGYGFPRSRGGPMFHADTVGLGNVVERMAEFAKNPHGDPAFWEPAPLLAKLAREGKTFN
ncbi:MAG TPA: 3-hydroxyacyl-CoA dehydrogenase NAD-binding domain-containing protein [Usitatibacter sp.]|jgi:3-hydroxyacyl-CoA dehydrogenase|nr:3-hydroxyacyl-CoA dehydrogenase NAD-binding domain-containing protein [Usitatibacter sp.]